MNMRFTISLSFLFIISFSLVGFTRKEKKELKPLLNKIIVDLETVLSEDWYIVPNEKGFEINYSFTCMAKSLQYLFYNELT